MADIVQRFFIKAPRERVFEAVSSPPGLDTWWTKHSAGHPDPGSQYQLDFGPSAQWRARVSQSVSGSEFELELTDAQEDWLGTRVGFDLEERDGTTHVCFHHTGWPDANDHYHTSCYCWAMYLRLLRRFVEHGEVVPYEARLDA